jgi:hypothetical protein
MPLEFGIVKEPFAAAIMRTLELQIEKNEVTSLSPWTVKCFFRDALSVKTFPHDSRWHEKILGCAFLFCFCDVPGGFPAPIELSRGIKGFLPLKGRF